jgi:hypothetical protein
MWRLPALVFGSAHCARPATIDQNRMLMGHVEIARDNWPFVNTQCSAAVAPVDDLGKATFHGAAIATAARPRLRERKR